ncbi:MAG TPA: hypothetical protein VFZ65_03145 [Planctomycetota bacterium]|nr:hypothetical protein [Planctomycetota bacterium]
MSMPIRYYVVAAAALSAVLPGQVARDSRGPLAGAATSVLVEGGVVAGHDAQTRVHRNGFTMAPTLPMPGVISAPDLEAIFLAQMAPAGIHVDDISTGRDDVLVDSNGVIDVPPSSWGVWSFSLRNGAIGVPAMGTTPASRIAVQAAQGSVGAALFSWILPGSNLPMQVVNRVERSHSREELGLPTTGSAEVDSIDFPLVLGLDQGLAVSGTSIVREPGFNGLISNPQAIYFTVSHGTRGLVPLPWWNYLGTPTLASGATILVVLKSSPGGPWTTPHVFKPYYTLGLLRDEDIDALAYDEVREKLLYSTVGTMHDQFLFADFSTDGAAIAQPVMMPNGGGHASDAIGKAQTDDVDAICTLDPTIGTIGGPPPGGDDFGSSVGTPRPGLLGVPTLGGSAYRRFQGGVVRFDTFLVGWPPNAGIAPGFAVAFLTSGNNLDPLLIGGIKLRNTANALNGDPQSETVVVPPALVLTGQRFTFRWFALDAATGELAEAWPVQVYL